MNKKELVTAIAERSGLTQKNADSMIKSFCDIVCEQVGSGEDVNLTGYMKFSQVERKARTAHNPRTREPIAIPATKTVKIQAGSKLKAAAKTS
ncbi:MAG: HU family DNA-binding protein [Acidimicrobiaceae bacterium]|nr:HU family DNA-binding protein [Acidimicrobiaceae bacterium]